ncbi:glycosyltransferase family 87 protein [Corynebacterium tapiri]|uniref:DUF2029 domain-containing protein n=1 Tax=Corynebacterium tapiri TaxID=1448266 RepID=A0A5C4U2L4_9CORY|nr:glycosyltransferase 87 family protein [Corynebacterium tapiri]TNL95343.1 DUF2029 domain-containing protein [Corynebacterium tapiri]
MRLSHPAHRVYPSLSEPAARGFTEFLGGPVGRFAAVGRARFFTPLRVLIALALTFLSFGYLSKAACLGGIRQDDGSVSLNWAGSRQYTAACYNDIVPLYSGRGLDQPGFVYAFSWTEGDLTRYMEYPVLAGLFQGIMGWWSRTTFPLIDALGAPIPAASWYFTSTACVFAVLWVLTIGFVAELTGNRVWDTVLVAASPIVIVHAFSNWDIPSIFLAVLAMWLIARARPGWALWAGVAIGLGTAFKLWPLYLLGAYLVLAVRARKLGAWVAMALTAAAAWLAVNIPIMLAYPEAWREFLRLNSERSWEWTTIWAVISRRTGWTGFDEAGEPTILNLVTFLLFAGACLGIAIYGWRVARTPRVAELVTLILAAFLLFNKVWSPQYSLWLVIPVVLALPRWRLLLTWMTTEMVLWPVLMWHLLGQDNKGAPDWLLDTIVITRDAFIVAICVLIIRQMARKVADPVRAAHQGHDPLAGEFGVHKGRRQAKERI